MSFLRARVSEADTRVIVDRREQHLLPRSARFLTLVSRHLVTGRHDVPKLLGLHFQQIASGRELLAQRRCRRLHAAEQRQRFAPELGPRCSWRRSGPQRCGCASARRSPAPCLPLLSVDWALAGCCGRSERQGHCGAPPLLGSGRVPCYLGPF